MFFLSDSLEFPQIMGALSDLVGSSSFHENIVNWNLQIISMDQTWIQITPKTFLGFFGPQRQPLLGFNLIVNLDDGRFYLTLFAKVKFLVLIRKLKPIISITGVQIWPLGFNIPTETVHFPDIWRGEDPSLCWEEPDPE